MKDQHTQIKGYRDLSQEEIDLMNEGKDLAERVGDWVMKLESISSKEGEEKLTFPDTDERWVAIGKDHLQQGFMASIRSIAKPTTF